MKRFFLLLIPLSIISCTQSRSIQKPTKNIYSELNDKIPKWLKEYDIPGVSVTSIEEGKIVWSKTFGMQNENTKATDSTLYLSASIAKPMTAEIFLRLASEGKVNLDESMAKYWLDPDIAEDDRAKLLTPRHVLTHQTGFKNWRRMTGGKLQFEWNPGTKMGYSGEGFLYLVKYLENKLKKPFNQIAKEVLFIPEEMHSASYVYQDGFDNKMAWPYFPNSVWQEPRKVENASGAGGLRITTQDYAKFVVSILNNNRVSSQLRKEQFTISLNQFEHCRKSSTTPDACPKNLGFGLGWYIYDFKNERVIGHTGANAAERTLAVFSPDTKKGLVVMSNGSNGNHILFKIADAIGINKNFIDIEKPKK
ncbi:serine hydrolase domain-containing protein [Aquimarina gracilis]|uniref:Serine hydrolase domain-containing protein n=1 Tax=Aquimarina gracilis TaxID=874422 RepID=A0ABU5ZRS1_9FLAO|nr:serine hydrolase domain-containing protein [Aquimarina gracilis]MEB3344765.1 serine hydrolase domain-containing protein [Aquimarina gracilis]